MDPKKIVCGKCGKEFEQNTGRGRPRKVCKDCRAPRSYVVAPTAAPVVPALPVVPSDATNESV